MRVQTSIPQIYTDQHGLKHSELTEKVGLLFNFGPKAEFRRYIFENEKKNPRKSALIRGKEVKGQA